MANATEAPATTQAEGPTSHTLDQAPKTGGALAIRADQTAWTPEQGAVLRQSGINEGVTAEELSAFLHLCQRTQLDPFSRQIYLIGRWDSREQRKVYTPQTSIDGYRVIAHRAAARAGHSLGYEDTLWCDSSGRWRDVWLADEPPAAAKVTVLRNGQRFSAVARYAEYVQTKKGGGVSGLWGKMAATMTAKCAEALALRMAFPHDLAGVYTAEEMAQADNPEPGQYQQRGPAAQQAQNPPSADGYMERLRKPEVWNNPSALLTIHGEVKADGLLNETVHGPDGETKLGDLIVARGTALKQEAAEREQRQAEEKPAAAAQVAAEAGVDPLDRLMEQTQRMWDNADALGQILEDARRHGQVDRQVEGPLGSWLPLGEMLTTRINDLKDQKDRKAAQGGNQTGEAA